MSRSDNGKCPDKGQWCGYIRDLCDGDCDTREYERMIVAFKTVAKVAKEMRQEWGIAPSILMDGWATTLESAIAEWSNQFQPHGVAGKQER